MSRDLPGVFGFSHPSGLLLAAELPGSLACGKTLGALGSFGCPLLLGNRGVHANGRDQSPRAALGTPPPGVHLSVEWYVPVCSLSWLLVYTVSVHAQSVVRGRTS